MKHWIILCLFLSGCTSSSAPTNLSITGESPEGWSKNGNNLQFNVGEQKHDFRNAPLGKLYYGFTGLFKSEDKKEEE